MKKILTAIAAIAGVAVMATGAAACDTTEKIYVDTNAFFAPFEYFEGKEIKGVDVDIMNLVGEKLGKKVVFENTDFDIIIDNVASGSQYDCGAAGITITEERAAKVAFSTPYYTSIQYVVFKGDTITVDGTSADGKNVEYVLWSSLAGKKIGVQLDTTGDIYANDEIDLETGELHGTGAEVKGYPDMLQAAADLNLAIDVLVIDELPAKYLTSNNSDLKCYALYYDAETATEEQYAICVNKDNKELLDAINEVLKELGEKGVNDLVSKHFGLEK